MDHKQTQTKAAVKAARVSRYSVSGVDCSACASTLRKQLLELPRVHEVAIDADASVQVVHSGAEKEIAATITSAGYSISRASSDPKRTFITRTAIALGSLSLTAVAFVLSSMPLWSMLTLAAAISLAGIPVLIKGIAAAIRFRADMNVLITIAATGAVIIGHHWEAALLVALFALGRSLEAWAALRSHVELSSLWRELPQTATVRRGTVQTIKAGEIVPGDIVLLKPGDRCPADGIIGSGVAVVNMAPITGESRPVTRNTGEVLYAGTTVYDGYIELTATATPFLSTPSMIKELIATARAGRTNVQNTIDRFASYYTPAVLILALLVAVVPPIMGAPLAASLYRSLALLVISCPCALMLAGPVATTAALTTAARKTIILRSIASLEQIAACKTVALDKTGTITTGKPRIASVETRDDSYDATEVCRLAAAVESRSNHPLATAIIDYAGGVPSDLEVTDFRIIPGLGVSARVNGKLVSVGSPRLFSDATTERSGIVCVGVGDRLIGVIETSDELRPGVADMVSRLRQMGVEVMMISGDDRITAEATAIVAGIATVYAELTPEEKLNKISAIASETPVMMVGDGVNDAPALARATIGVALGGTSVQAALDSADACIVDDDVTRIVDLITLSRATKKVVIQSIAISIGLKFLAAGAIIPGWLSLFMAIIADDGALLLVTLNGLRLLKKRGRSN